jgi:hypothetical protein
VNAKLDGEFREFMHAGWPVMVRLAYGMTGDQGHAEDVTQAAFARAYASWPRVRRAGDSAPGVIALGTIDGKRWQFTAAKPRSGGQVFTGSGPAFGGDAGSQPGFALAVESADPVFRGGMCIQVPAAGITSAFCVPAGSGLHLNSGLLSMSGNGLRVAAGYVPASTAWVIVNQPYGTTTKVYPVAVGGQKLFAVQVLTGPNPLSWTAYDSSGHVVRWPTG